MPATFAQAERRSLAKRDPRSVYVIHPYYTGRDKGCLCDSDGPLLFRTESRAWHHVFFVAQPNDPRALDNYRVVTLAEYREGV